MFLIYTMFLLVIFMWFLSEIILTDYLSKAELPGIVTLCYFISEMQIQCITLIHSTVMNFKYMYDVTIGQVTISSI